MGSAASSSAATTAGSATGKSSSLPKDPMKYAPEDNSIASTSGEGKQQIKKKKKRPIPNNLSGPALVEYRCRKKKKEWNTCVSNWYGNKFLSGKALEQEGECDEFFEIYKTCYIRGMAKERQKKGLGSPEPGSMLAEYIEEENE